MNEESVDTSLTDRECIARSRAGDSQAFSVLWSRHHRAAVRVARQFTSLDADDLVSEAYARVLARVRAGGGPRDVFRPYLYTTIRNLARSWGRGASRTIQVEEIDTLADDRIPDDPSVAALDRSLTVTAFRSLPERWQTVLWYTEVEGMDPHEVAPILGLSPNGVAALSYRAREGLRAAWLQAHVGEAATSEECRWVLARLGESARDRLGARQKTRWDAHLVGCARCAIVAEEVEEVGSHLASVLIPLVLGGAAGGSFLASLAGSSGAGALEASLPATPGASEAVAATGSLLAPPIAGGIALGTTIGRVALIGGAALAVAVAVGSGTVVATAPEPDAPTVVDETGGADDVTDPGLEGPLDAIDDSAPPAPAALGDHVESPGDLAASVLETIQGGEPPAGHSAPGGVVGLDLALSGAGTPGAHVSLQGAGQVYATTTVAPDGTFALRATGLPSGITDLALVQTVDDAYLLELLAPRGLLGGMLSPVEGLVSELVAPLSLEVLPGDVAIELLTSS